MIYLALAIMVSTAIAFACGIRVSRVIAETWRRASLTRAKAIRYAAKANNGLILPAITRAEQGPDALFYAWAGCQRMDPNEIEAIRYSWRILSGLDPADEAGRLRAEAMWSRYEGHGIDMPPIA